MESSNNKAVPFVAFNDEMFGDLVWLLGAPMAYLREEFMEYLNMLTESAEAVSGPQDNTPEDVEEAIQEAMIEHEDLLQKLAPIYFREALANLIVDVQLRVLQDHQITMLNPEDGTKTITTLREMLGSEFERDIRESRQQMADSIRAHVKRQVGLHGNPGRRLDLIPAEIAKYVKETHLLIKKAREEISEYGVKEEMNWLQRQPEFAALQQYPDLMSRLFMPGIQNESARLAREYAVRKFALPKGEDALRQALSKRKKGRN